jgi:methionine synthase I (cobalamin-dependent)
VREPPPARCNVTPFSPPTVDLLAWLTPARCLLAHAVHRDLVVDVHTDYLLAGADIITTNNFVCVEHQLAREGLQAELVSMTQAAASCATQAVERARSRLPAGSTRELCIAGALPPLEICYFPPDLSADQMVSQYSAIASALSPSVDVLLGETLSSAAEACAAATAAAATGRPAWVALTLHDDLSSTLRGGDSLESTVAQLLALKLPKLEGILVREQRARAASF